SDDFYAVTAALERIERNASYYAGLGKALYQSMFSSRHSADKKSTVRAIRASITYLEKILAAVEE
ncbi:MAG: hypothetical protein AAB903_02700, partial [Patescibacteria group bacterium]